MNNLYKKTLFVASIGAITLSLAGCGAMNTFIKHRNLESESKMSNTIFLNPVSAKDKTIFVQVRNTSGQDFSKFEPYLLENLKASGWKVVDDMSKAHDMLQVNLLQFGKAKNPNAVWDALTSGYGGAVTGGLAGVATGMLTDSSGIGLGVGAAVGVASWAADELYSDVTYSAISDIQISVRTKGNVSQETDSDLSQGSQTNISQSFKETSHWLKYRTRIGSVVQKANLTPGESMPILSKQQANEVAGIFGDN